MGGFGSGWYYRNNAKKKVGDCLSLSSTWLYKKGLLKDGIGRNITWSRTKLSGESVVYASMNCCFVRGKVHLIYSCNNEKLNYPVKILWTDCTFGGERAWFACPKCDNQVEKLYLHPSKVFLCRKCSNLTYESCNKSKDPAYRYSEKAKKLRGKARAKDNCLLNPYPQKPKGMHWKTYFHLKGDYEKCSSLVVLSLYSRAKVCSKRFGKMLNGCE